MQNSFVVIIHESRFTYIRHGVEPSNDVKSMIMNETASVIKHDENGSYYRYRINFCGGAIENEGWVLIG